MRNKMELKMNKLSNIISSVVISLYEAKEIGIVYDITLDEKTKKCKYMCILNEDNEITNVIHFKDIYAIGNDCVYIKNQKISELQNNLDRDISLCKSPLNLKVYDIMGNFLGICQDIEIDDNYYATSIVTNNNHTISTNQIINMGNIIIVGNKKIPISKFRPDNDIKIHATTSNEKVAILNTIPSAKPLNNNNKIITDSTFLLGRKVINDIRANNGEIIAKSGSTINKEIIYKTGLYGKIIELSRYSVNA